MKIERVKKNSGILLSSLSTGDVFSLKGDKPGDIYMYAGRDLETQFIHCINLQNNDVEVFNQDYYVNKLKAHIVIEE